MRIIDLSLPIAADHPRWKVEVTATGDLTKGDLAQVTWLKVSCHAFTHVDARRHMFLDGATIESTSLDALVGPCAVVDLMDTQPNEAIDAKKLAARGKHIARGGMVLLKTNWDRQRSPTTKEFWLDSPYLTRDAAEWLLATGIRTIGYSFPQDYPIRLMLKGEVRPLAEQVTHDVLLRAGVHMIEYVANTAEIREPNVFLSAAPLNIPGADGAPARAYCIEGM
jgi:arylformamidase